MTSGQTFKLVCMLVYALIVAAATIYVGLFPSVNTRVRQPIQQDHRISDTDIESLDAGSIRGRYSKRDLKPGDPITAADTLEAPPAEKRESEASTQNPGRTGIEAVGGKLAIEATSCFEEDLWKQEKGYALCLPADRMRPWLGRYHWPNIKGGIRLAAPR